MFLVWGVQWMIYVNVHRGSTAHVCLCVLYADAFRLCPLDSGHRHHNINTNNAQCCIVRDTNIADTRRMLMQSITLLHNNSRMLMLLFTAQCFHCVLIDCTRRDDSLCTRHHFPDVNVLPNPTTRVWCQSVVQSAK